MTPTQQMKLDRPALRQRVVDLITQIYPEYSKLNAVNALVERRIRREYGIEFRRYGRTRGEERYVIVKGKAILKSFPVFVDGIYTSDSFKDSQLKAQIFYLETVLKSEPISIVDNTKKFGPFTDEFLDHIGFVRTKGTVEDQYGKAESIRPKGKRILEWNLEGYSCDYFGNPVKPNIAIEILEDGGTRTVFSGLIYSVTDLIKLLTLVQ